MLILNGLRDLGNELGKDAGVDLPQSNGVFTHRLYYDKGMGLSRGISIFGQVWPAIRACADVSRHGVKMGSIYGVYLTYGFAAGWYPPAT